MNNLVELSYTDFLNIIQNSKLKLTNLMSFDEDCIKFIFEVKDQSVFYKLTDFSYLDENVKDKYLEYGICTSKFDTGRSKRILFIDPERDMYEQINEQLGKVNDFTNLVVISEDSEVIREIEDEVKSIYPNIALLQYVTMSEDYDAIMSSISKEVGTDNLMDLKPYCETLENADLLSAEYIDLFIDVANLIHSSNSSSSIYVISDPQFMETFKSLVCELYIRFGDKFYVPTSEVNSMINLINHCTIDRDKMLVEDIVNYFENHPRYMISKSPRSIDGLYFLIMDPGVMKLSISYFNANQLEDLDSVDKLQSNVFESKEIKVMPLGAILDINSNNKKAKDVINLFYKKVKDVKDIVSILDLVYFMKDGNEYLGYLNSFAIDIPYIKYSEMGWIKLNMDAKEFERTIPVTEFLDGPYLCKNSLHECFSGSNVFKFKNSYLNPPMQKYRGVPVLGLKYRLNEKWNDLKNVSPLEVGLFHDNCYKVRRGFGRILADKVGLDKVRDKVDIYGGFNPIYVKSIKL